MRLTLSYLDSPVGIICLKGMEGSLMKIEFVEDKIEKEIYRSKLTKAMKQLDEYFSGKRILFQIPTHLVGTHFQQNVWDEIQNIPYGKTKCYEDIARSLGDVKVIRAAATANGKNPLPIIVPCHRVLGKDGSLTGYSGGLWRKKWLLDFEQREARPKLL